jgi:hypothetical protein
MSLDLPPDCAAVARRPTTHRSRISNGADLLPNTDGRSAMVRRFRDVTSQIIADQGGIDRCAESRLQLIRRFATASCIAEEMEAALVRGEKIDIAQHALLCSTLHRLAGRIGINRRAKPILSPLQYAAELDRDPDGDEEVEP